LLSSCAQLSGTLAFSASSEKWPLHSAAESGIDLELLHDIHERIEPIDAINLCKEVEKYRPSFMEDPFAPEQNGYFKQLRQQCARPIAVGELFNSPHEWRGPR